MTERTLIPDISRILDAASGGDAEAFVRAIEAELDPAVEFLKPVAGETDLGGLRWILMELVANAVLAPMGRAVMTRAGLTRRASLDALGANPVWGSGTLETPDRDPEEPALVALERGLGCTADEFLALDLPAKFRLLGLLGGESWVQVRVVPPAGPSGFQIEVRSLEPATPDDIEEVRKRFEDFEGTRREIENWRGAFLDEGGVYRAPSFTGGGGVGLLACIGRCRALGLQIEYEVGKNPAGTLKFLVFEAPPPRRGGAGKGEG
jgi:hypothetical protein